MNLTEDFADFSDHGGHRITLASLALRASLRTHMIFGVAPKSAHVWNPLADSISFSLNLRIAKPTCWQIFTDNFIKVACCAAKFHSLCMTIL